MTAAGAVRLDGSATTGTPELVRRAAEITPVVAAAAADADTDRRLPQHVMDAVRDAGFARQFVPARWGGFEGTFADTQAAVMLLAEHCPSTAWLASLAAILGRIAGYLPAGGQRLIWSAGPDALVVGSLLPLGTAYKVHGGWLVSGRWPYISSVEFSDWALVVAMVRAADGERARCFAVPRADYAIDSTWSNLGMRATGSHTLVLEPTLVRPECSFDRADLDRAGLDRGSPASSVPQRRLVPLEAWAGLAFAPAVAGAARGALRAWLRAMRGKVAAIGCHDSAPIPRSAYELALTRSAGEIDAAAVLLNRVALAADAGALTDLDVAVCARDCALSAELARAATDRLVRAAGTSGLAEGQPLERFWRDVHTGSSHIMLQLSRAAQGFAPLVLSSEDG
jgi:alkylation response protein AidB-like acyl-CoA dehydrogenase